MNQNKCLFEYCNFDNPYLKLYIFQNNNKTFNEITLDLNQYKLDNGVIENIDEIVNVLKKEMNKLGISALPKASLLLRCRKVYHDTLILPIKNHLQALYLYNKDIKSKTNKQDYYTVKNHYRYGDRYIFNTYFVPDNIVQFISKIAKKLNTAIYDVRQFGMELQEFLNIEKDYVYFYTVNNTCTMILVSNGKLITCYDFEFDNEKTILSTFMLVTSKYEQEYGINSITHYGFKSDQEIEIKLDLIKISK